MHRAGHRDRRSDRGRRPVDTRSGRPAKVWPSPTGTATVGQRPRCSDPIPASCSCSTRGPTSTRQRQRDCCRPCGAQCRCKVVNRGAACSPSSTRQARPRCSRSANELATGAASRALQLIATSVLVAVLLWQMRGSLPLPDGFSLTHTERWLLDQGPLVAAFAVVRGIALLAAVYTAVIGAIGLLAVVIRSSTLATITVRLTLPSLRPLIAPLAAFTFTVSSALPASAAPFADPTATARRCRSRETGRRRPERRRSCSCCRPPRSLARRSDTRDFVHGRCRRQLLVDRRATRGERRRTRAVRCRGRPYWRVLIEANRDHLAVPGEPDLIYPGQVFTLPPVS